MKATTKVQKMYVLDGGNFLYAKSFILYNKMHTPEGNETIRIPTPYFVFQTTEGWVMYDTGWNKSMFPLLESSGSEPEITEENLPKQQLEKIGITPSDISKVILSHIHPDHSGNIDLFENATIYIQRDDYTFGKYPHPIMPLSSHGTPIDAPHLKWEFLNGSEEIIPGLTVVRSPGHTCGFQSLVVELPESGFYVLTGDAAYSRTNLIEETPPGAAWNHISAHYSIKNLKAISELLNAKIIPGHDPETFPSLLDYHVAYS